MAGSRGLRSPRLRYGKPYTNICCNNPIFHFCVAATACATPATFASKAIRKRASLTYFTFSLTSTNSFFSTPFCSLSFRQSSTS